jgi:pyruvate dehydrogenase E1 component alpha subunit
MNLAALWRCPVLFCCENNLYAMGTALARSEAQTTLTAKAPGYNVPALSVDGMDLVAVRQAALGAVMAVREGRGPFFLELKTYRFRAHSMFDAQLYRDKAEVESWRAHDPIARFEAELRSLGLLDDAALAALEGEVDEEVAAAVAFAEAGTWEPVEDLCRDVYAPVEAGT